MLTENIIILRSCLRLASPCLALPRRGSMSRGFLCAHARASAGPRREFLANAEFNTHSIRSLALHSAARNLRQLCAGATSTQYYVVALLQCNFAATANFGLSGMAGQRLAADR